MPGLKIGPSTTTITASPLDAARAAQARRRLWQHPDLTSHSLLVLTFEQVYLTSEAGIPKPEVVTAVEAGADLEQVLGSLAVVIDLVSVRRLRLDLQTNSLVIEYLGNGVSTSQQRVTFATPEAADACFTKIWRRLGSGFGLASYRRDNWALARGPLGLLAGALLVTAALAIVLSVFEDMASARAASRVNTPGLGELGSRMNLPQSPLEVLIGWLDWRVVCGLGGVVAAVSQVWLYRRLTTPPASLELIRN
jgi:hypothetical protein